MDTETWTEKKLINISLLIGKQYDLEQCALIIPSGFSEIIASFKVSAPGLCHQTIQH